ncbi:hypothetical protein DPMN_043355 [Dreissena polymorpha]|uniref:Uncharacterized protein n=1 Tax=Dreissena polymorpha TaxID=45954 RepID=A0A9D4D276_DREPO|nr:hypothetical protein DPMN_043355 [Dreissena polymorpha]
MDKAQEQQVLLQGLNMPKPSMTGNTLPEARQKPTVLPSPSGQKFEFQSSPCTAGLARKRTGLKRKAETERPLTPVFILPAMKNPICIQQAPIITLPDQPSLPPAKDTKKNARKYTTPDFVKCSRCGENRKQSTTHQSYMFHIYCKATETKPFEDWRKEIKEMKDQEKKAKKQK